MSNITAPMGGKILNVKVNVGDSISEGDEVIIIEAMKMELPIAATAKYPIAVIDDGNRLQGIVSKAAVIGSLI